MPELEHDITTAIPPETLLARAIAEYIQVTRASLEDVQFLRRAVAAPATCSHEGRLAVGSTGEFDQVFPCARLATVHNLADDAGYCLPHHRKAEAAR